MDYKTFLGYACAGIQFASFLVYFWGIYKGATKPHAFTWFVWGTINAVGFAAVFSSGGGTGSYTLAVNIICCFIIALIGWIQNQVEYDKYDWLALLGAFTGIFLWWVTNDALFAVVLVALSDGIGMIPTFRKAYRLPFEENILSFLISTVMFPVSIFALESFTPTTWLYPIAIAVFDGSLSILIIVRRKKLK